MIAVDNPTIGGADGVGEISFWLVRMSGGKDFIDIPTLIGAIFSNFPFIPDFDAAVF